MNSQQQLLVLVSALALASSAASAGNFTETTTTSINSTLSQTYIFGFTPLLGADKLVSASGGSFYAGEGGHLTVYVDYTNNTQAQIYDRQADNFETFAFTTVLSNLSFTTGDIDGLTFVFANHSSGAQPILTISQGTNFVFEAQSVATAAPEPATWTLMIGGFAALGAAAAGLRRQARGVA